MSDAQAAPEAPAQLQHADYKSVLQALVGKKITVVNPESYEAKPMAGFQLKEGYYEGKITGVGEDYVLFLTTVTLSKKEGGHQAVQQFIPIDRVKRVSAMKGAIILHI